MDIDKLERMFKVKYKALAKNAGDEEFFVNYCDEHKILMLHPEWLAETLNDNAMKGMVCIHSPEHQVLNTASPWLLVPKKFAERALILGGLP
jgi:hypothetical protein